MVKKVLIGVMLFFMAVTVPVIVPSCGKSSPNGTDNPGPSINTPTNNYTVRMMVVYFGGLGGCVTGSVSRDSAGVQVPVMDAQVTLNGVAIDTMGESYTKLGIVSDPGTSYALKVTHGGAEIASGTAIMPVIPVFTAPASQVHAKNTALAVTWNTVSFASTIGVEVAYTDTVSGIEDSTVYSSPSLAGTETSVTVPASAFAGSGTYIVTISAINGLPAGLDLENLDTTKGYNITGAAGVFLAANTASDTLYVDYFPPRKNVLAKFGMQALVPKRLAAQAARLFGLRAGVR